MYINFSLCEKHNFKWQDNPLLVLQAIKQKDYQLLKDCPKELLNQLYKDGYIQLINPKRKDEPKFMLVRLTDKGKNLLKQVEIADISDDSLQLSQKLISLYESNGFTVQNKRKIISLCSWFLANTEFSVEQIFSCAENYINSTERTYVSQLHNLIWKGESVFSNKWDLSQSKLYSLLTSKQ